MKFLSNSIFFITYSILSAGGLILFKAGSNNLRYEHIKSVINFELPIQVIIGILCYGFSFLMWLMIVSKLDLTYAMPLGVGFTNIFVIIGSKLILNESITMNKIIAIVLITIAVFIISIDK